MANSVLIVEDDVSTVALWTRHLEHHGVEVYNVPSAEEAERLLAIYQPNAIVLDIILQDIETGWDLLAKLRASSETHDLPVFVVSSVDDPRRAKREGANDFFTKPCPADKLVHRIFEEIGYEGTNF
jgi:DNA-binding response OmpR family regulator